MDLGPGLRDRRGRVPGPRANGFSIDSGIADIDRLLSRGGMDSMLLTIWLIIGAVTFGAILEEFGLAPTNLAYGYTGFKIEHPPVGEEVT